jgi:hypothetical protein
MKQAATSLSAKRSNSLTRNLSSAQKNICGSKKFFPCADDLNLTNIKGRIHHPGPVVSGFFARSEFQNC